MCRSPVSLARGMNRYVFAELNKFPLRGSFNTALNLVFIIMFILHIKSFMVQFTSCDLYSKQRGSSQTTPGYNECSN